MCRSKQQGGRRCNRRAKSSTTRSQATPPPTPPAAADSNPGADAGRWQPLHQEGKQADAPAVENDSLDRLVAMFRQPQRRPEGPRTTTTAGSQPTASTPRMDVGPDNYAGRGDYVAVQAGQVHGRPAGPRPPRVRPTADPDANAGPGRVVSTATGDAKVGFRADVITGDVTVTMPRTR